MPGDQEDRAGGGNIQVDRYIQSLEVDLPGLLEESFSAKSSRRESAHN